MTKTAYFNAGGIVSLFFCLFLMSWKSFLKSTLNQNIEKIGLSASYASLATVRMDNTPAVRTVVMRGFVAEHHKEETGLTSDLLVITTDKRTEKMKEIENNPNVEINWYAHTQHPYIIKRLTFKAGI